MRKKKNFHKVPDSIWEKLKTLNTSAIVVACSKQLPIADIANGKWLHLGISLQGGSVMTAQEVLPDEEQGRYSYRNLHGNTVVRKDLPKVLKSFTIEVPNFGDWSKGSHDITITREVYQREFFAPHELTISSEVLKQDQETAVLKVTVNEVLDPKSKDFEQRLLFNLNILQENVGTVSVFASAASTADYLQTIHVDWELLPEGSRDAVMQKLLTGVRSNVQALKERIEARRKLLESFHPTSWIVGNSGLRRYFGAKFRENLVVFENVDYGNAIYVLFDNWDQLSKLSRIELMERKEAVVRIVHRRDWERKLRKLLEDNLGPFDQRQAA